MTKKKDPSELTFLGKLPEYDCPLADAVRMFGSKTALATELGLGKIDNRTGQRKNDRQVITEWFRRGVIPRQYVMPLHELTKIPLDRLLTPFKPYLPGRGDNDESAVKNVAKKAVGEMPASLRKRLAKKAA